MGENDPTVSSGVCVRVRFFLIEIIGEWIGYCKAFLDLGARTFPERIVKTNGGLFARNSLASGPSWPGVVLVVADADDKRSVTYIDVRDGGSFLALRIFELCHQSLASDQVIK